MSQLQGAEHPTGLYELAILKFVRNRVAVVGLLCLALIVLAVLFADIVTPYDPIERNTPERNLGPSLAHPFGTDKLGRDIMSRVLYGGRVSLQVGFLSIALTTLVSVPLGLIGGFVGGLVDDFIMRVMDLILAFPGLILAIWLVSLLGSNMTNVIFAIAFFSLPTYARLIRGVTLSIREMEYVMAARSMGAGAPRIMFFHVLPGVLGPLIVLTTLGVSGAIVTGASLSFLGLGVSPPTPEWGAMLADGRNYMRTQWWIAVFPGITITLVVLILNIIGDALRDALDPNVRA
ncbi:MAG: ABC transporter permease [Chloroflexi bacterium]|nr:ABC transporter permease [Chloroflexota bacterium]